VGIDDIKIERREYKYLIDQNTVRNIRESIRPFCVVDPFAATHPNQRYTIESLYFDNPGMQLFWNNEIEAVDRFKLRIRHYPQTPDGPLFLEVKRRFNDVISKTRGCIPREGWQELVQHPPADFRERLKAKDRNAVERFLAVRGLGDYQPLTVVRYEREPYVSVIDDYARITFDTCIRSQPMRDLSFEVQPNAWRNMDDSETMKHRESLTVLELKFTSAVPSWMVNIVRTQELHRLSFSKYGTSVKAWYSARSPRIAAWKNS
jgi:SPX domain protein involved in polyphosphate accumulation